MPCHIYVLTDPQCHYALLLLLYIIDFGTNYVISLICTVFVVLLILAAFQVQTVFLA